MRYKEEPTIVKLSYYMKEAVIHSRSFKRLPNMPNRLSYYKNEKVARGITKIIGL